MSVWGVNSAIGNVGHVRGVSFVVSVICGECHVWGVPCVSTMCWECYV